MPEKYECSSRGDKRFSAFYARVNGRSIETIYQCDIKGYDPGGTNWHLGKGKPPRNSMSREDTKAAYKKLWEQYLEENPELKEFLKEVITSGKKLNDRFARKGCLNQAEILEEIILKI